MRSPRLRGGAVAVGSLCPPRAHPPPPPGKTPRGFKFSLPSQASESLRRRLGSFRVTVLSPCRARGSRGTRARRRH